MEHHAYIYEGPLPLPLALADDAKARFKFGEHSPDLHVREFEKFGIDESRWLSATASLRSASGRALFVVGVGSMTSESQQALLKLFEEPQQGVVFVLLVPYGTVQPTLRSRMLPYPTVLDGVESGGDAAKFLKADGKSRSDFITKLLKDDEGVKERVRELLAGCEALLIPKIADPKVRGGLEDIQKVRSYVGDRSASLKMLLEHLAVSLPKL
jgi:hypothetical protein